MSDELEQVRAAAKEAWDIAWDLLDVLPATAELASRTDVRVARLDAISKIIGIPKSVITELHGIPYVIDKEGNFKVGEEKQ